jgi:hypothetical protein
MNLVIVVSAALLIARPLIAAPDDLESAFQSLTEATARKDAVQVKKLAVETCALARRIILAPAPEDEAGKEAWKQRVAYASNVELQTEYALYSTALQAPPATTIDLLSTLEQQNPKSQYLDCAYCAYFLALNQTGAGSKVLPIAEKAIKHFPDNEDLLLVLADAAASRKQSALALNYAEHLVAVLRKHPAPEGISPGEWERKRNAALGRGHLIAGLMQYEKAQYYDADKNLRAALPLIKGKDAETASALFYLGVANYQLGSMTRNKALVLEAAKFSDQAAAIKGPLSQQAWRNAQVMRTEAGKMR